MTGPPFHERGRFHGPSIGSKGTCNRRGRRDPVATGSLGHGLGDLGREKGVPGTDPGTKGATRVSRALLTRCSSSKVGSSGAIGQLGDVRALTRRKLGHRSTLRGEVEGHGPPLRGGSGRRRCNGGPTRETGTGVGGGQASRVKAEDRRGAWESRVGHDTISRPSTSPSSELCHPADAICDCTTFHNRSERRRLCKMGIPAASDAFHGGDGDVESVGRSQRE